MKKEYGKSLFIFRRDLRLEDSTALINALQSSDNSLFDLRSDAGRKQVQ